MFITLPSCIKDKSFSSKVSTVNCLNISLFLILFYILDLSGLFLFLLSCEIALNIDVSRPKKLTSFSQFFSAIMTRLPSPAIIAIHLLLLQSTLDISNCQGTNKFVRDIESSTDRVVILCKFIRMGPHWTDCFVQDIESSTYRDIEISKFDCIRKVIFMLVSQQNT